MPIALVDKPREQLRDVMWLQLAGAAGHVAIVGSTLSGKSTALRSMVCGLALTHTSSEVQVYCLDFGGGSLGTLRDLPHVGGVSGRLDTVGVRRTVGEISTLVADREALIGVYFPITGTGRRSIRSVHASTRPATRCWLRHTRSSTSSSRAAARTSICRPKPAVMTCSAASGID